PRGIVGQLLEIAKENDAMSEIGGATSWRWQEGIISRMPKTKTVAKILTKAFETSEPNIWYEKTTGDLSSFIKKNFSVCDNFIGTINKEINDVYEAYFLSSIMASGVTEEEAIYGLCYLKYARSLEEESEFYPEVEFSVVKSLHGNWAEQKLRDLVRKFKPFKVDDKFLVKDETLITSESYVRYFLELSALRNKMVGFNSHFDMWRIFTTALSDEEHIMFERKFMSFFNSFTEEIRKLRNENVQVNIKKRTFSFSCLTLPTIGEVLK
ncbi:unnamed protein product, partial [Chrysoparadoxa australica]